MKNDKVKYSIEYIFPQTATNVLWSNISTPRGLENWFADSVTAEKNEWTFTWNATSQQAHCVINKTKLTVKFKWVHEKKDNYFEFSLFENELIHTTTLIITDFSYEEDIETDKKLWENQIGILKRNLGI